MAKIKILIVGMCDSIHIARWISNLKMTDWDVRVFSSSNNPLFHPDLNSTIVYSTAKFRNRFQKKGSSGFGVMSDALFKFLTGSNVIARMIRLAIKLIFPSKRMSITRRLEKVIQSFNPDIIHSMETQEAGYLVLETKRHLTDGNFPPWLHTNWGSDIYLFGKLSKHAPKIREVLTECDYYSCECKRDVVLAQKYGFSGGILPVLPNSGGFDLASLRILREACLPCSQRRSILVKGYQGWAGRAFCAIRALSRAKDVLNGYSVYIYSNNTDDMKIAAELLATEANIPVIVLEQKLPHLEMLKLHGRARISIGLSISDAISTSFLESLVMGSFPIQSWTSSADEWITDGEGGILVPPEDPEIVERALRRAISDDDLVDKAMNINWHIVENRLDNEKIRRLIIRNYKSILDKSLEKDCWLKEGLGALGD